jgi:hypothetical protein
LLVLKLHSLLVYIQQLAYFKVLNLNARNPKIRLKTKERLAGIVKPQTEITPPIKKFIKWMRDTAVKITAALFVI